MRKQKGFLHELEAILVNRRKKPTGSLASKLVCSPQEAGKKIVEESAELSSALMHETGGRVASEAADVIFALLAGLASRKIALNKVIRILKERNKK